MNYDHLRTRIFDVKEKKMLYQPNDYKFISSDCFLWNKELVYFKALGKDRYIPMSCSGQKDQNKKLIYDSDIVKICDGVDCSYHEIVWGYHYPAFDIFPLLYDDCNSLQAALTELFVEVVGNKFLNPDLLPKEQNHE